MIFISFVRGDRHDLLTICSVVCINRYWTLLPICERFVVVVVVGAYTRLLSHSLSPYPCLCLSVSVCAPWPYVCVCVLCLRRRQQYILSYSLLLTAATATVPFHAASHYFFSPFVRVCVCNCQCMRASCIQRNVNVWILCRVCRTTPRFRMTIHTHRVSAPHTVRRIQKIEKEKRFTALRRLDYSRCRDPNALPTKRAHTHTQHEQHEHTFGGACLACVHVCTESGFDVVAEIVLCYGLRN